MYFTKLGKSFQIYFRIILLGALAGFCGGCTITGQQPIINVVGYSGDYSDLPNPLGGGDAWAQLGSSKGYGSKFDLGVEWTHSDILLSVTSSASWNPFERSSGSRDPTHETAEVIVGLFPDTWPLKVNISRQEFSSTGSVTRSESLK